MKELMIGQACAGVLISGVALACACAVGCRSSSPEMQHVFDRHQRAMALLPDEQGSWSPPRDVPVAGADAEALLPDDVLTLEDARAIAVRANPDIHAAQARLLVALARIAEARSRYFPTISVALNSSRTFMSPASRNRLATGLQPATIVPTDTAANSLAITSLLNALRLPLFGANIGGNTNPFSEHSVAFSGTWTVFDGFVREAQVLAAKHLYWASEDALRDVERLIVRAIDAAYYQVQLAQEQIRIARADENFSEEQYDETRKLQEAGRATSADVNNFRVRVLAAKASVTAAVGLRDSGRVLLAELMGLPSATFPDALDLSALLVETEAELTLPKTDDWIASALAHRPDLAQLKKILKSDSEDVRAAVGLFLPSITASGSWGFDRGSNLHLTEDDQSAALGVEIRWDLYTGGRRSARVRAAQGAVAQALAELNRRKLAVISEVRRAVVDLQDAQEQIRLQRENLEVARESRRIVQAGYLAGKETLTRLNEAQRDFIAADADLTLARIRLRRAWSDLRTAVGAGVSDPAADDETVQPNSQP